MTAADVNPNAYLLHQLIATSQSDRRGVFMKIKLTQLVLSLGMLATVLSPLRFAHAQEAPQRIEITAKRFAYEPSEITVKKGQPVVLVIRSLDVAHGLRFRELNLNVTIDKNGSGELSFTPEKTGDFIGHCSVFCGMGHGSMTLTLHVVN
jgi:cytochrome c oxidase subunit II